MKLLLLTLILDLIFAQNVQITGNVQVTQSFGDKTTLNANTQKDNPFSRFRSKIFLFSALDDDIEVDIELAFDDFAQSDRWFWIHGASISFNRLFDSDLFNLKVGKIPLNVGAFINRVNEAENNLIGVPLLYHYRTLLDWEQVWDGNSQAVLRQYRDPSTAVVSYEHFPTASPIAYEAVWDYGVNLNGFDSFYEYSLMLSTGSLSNPKKNYEEHLENELQFSSRIGLLPTEWANIGFSFARNNYLSTNINQPQVHNRDHFQQELYGVDLSLEFLGLQIFTEYFENYWDNVNSEKFYKASTGFVEFAWTTNFSTKWQVVGRYDFMSFNKILVDKSSPQERDIWWDSDLNRLEFGLVYQHNRKLKIKTIYQQWEYEHYPTIAFSAIQLLVLF